MHEMSSCKWRGLGYTLKQFYFYKARVNVVFPYRVRHVSLRMCMENGMDLVGHERFLVCTTGAGDNGARPL